MPLPGHCFVGKVIGMKPALLIVYTVLGLIFLITGWGVLKKHSAYPSVQAGYHVKDAMENRKTWELANRAAGKLSLVCGMVVWLLMAVLWLAKATFGLCLGMLFIVAIAAVCLVILVPLGLLRKNKGT